MIYQKKKLYISVWWLLQLCGMFILGVRHLGHMLVVILLLSSLVGYVFGGRKVAIVSAFGLASYSALSLIGALLFYVAESGFVYWLFLAAIIIIAILNLIISFGIIKRMRNNLLY